MKMIFRSHTPHGASACRHGPRVGAASTQTPRCLVRGDLVAGGQGLRGVSSSVSPLKGTVPLPRQGCLQQGSWTRCTLATADDCDDGFQEVRGVTVSLAGERVPPYTVNGWP